MSNLLTNIEIFDDKVLVTQINEAGMGITKTVSPEELGQAFSMNVKLDTGFLPCIEGVVRYIKGGNKVCIIYQVPEKNRDIQYADTSLTKTFKNVRTPWTIFITVLQCNMEGEYSIVSEYCYATKGPLLTGLDTLYRFPLTNVFYPGARICWGNNARGFTWRNIAGLISHIELFYSSAFNAHLDKGNYNPLKVTKNGTTAEITSVSSLIQHLQDKDKFPVEILKQGTGLKTVLDDIINTM